jgi:dCMP deaminase
MAKYALKSLKYASLNHNIQISPNRISEYCDLLEKNTKIYSKDPVTKIGAMFVNSITLRVLSFGYNCMPNGINETPERWARPLKYKWSEHAERNAIFHCAKHGDPLNESICFTTMFPCSECARSIIQVGCRLIITPNIDEYDKELYSRWKDEWDISMEMLNEAKIDIISYSNLTS